MPRTKFSEYSAVASDNTDIDGIFIGEGMAPSDVNNSQRAFLSQVREFIDGTSGDTLTSAKIVATTAEILSGVSVTGTATFNSAVVLSSSITGSALSLSGALTVGGAAILSSTLGVTGTASMGVIDATTLEVTNVKAKDGTAAFTIADSTGVVTIPSSVLTSADINGGTVDNTAIGSGTPSTGAFTTLSSNSTTTLNGTTIPASKTLVVTTDIGVSVQAYDAQLADVAGLTPTDGNFIVGNGSNFITESGATARTSLGLGSIATQAADNVNLDGGAIDGTAIGAGTPSTGAFTTLSSNSTTTLNGTTIPASKTLLVSTDIGSTVQAYDAQLADVAGLTPTDGNFIVGNGTNFITESGATARTSLGLGTISTQAADNVNIDGGAVDGVTLGTNSAVTEAQIDNVNINGNTIISTDTNGDLNLTPNGTGDLVLDGLKWPQADGSADYVLKTDGAGQLSWTAQSGGSPGGSDTQIQYNSSGSFAGASGLVTDGSNLTLNAQGDLRFADSDSSNWVAFQAPATVATNVTWTLPDADGTSGQLLSTNGSGTLSWASSGGTGTVTSVDVSGGTTGLTTSGGPITSSGTITIAGTLAVANGGTGLTTLGSANQVLAVNSGGTALEYQTVSGGISTGKAIAMAIVFG